MTSEMEQNQTSPTTEDPCAPKDAFVFVFQIFMFGLFPLAVLGIFLNSICIIVFHRQNSRLTSVHLLKLLAACDTLFLVVCLIHFPFRHIFVLLTDSQAIFAHGDNQIEPLTYYITIPWYFMLLQTRNWIIVVVSTDRFLNLVYPMWARTALTRKKLNIVCALIVLISILTHLPRYWGQYLEDYDDPCETISQSIKISYHAWEGLFDKAVYMSANVFLPLMLLYILNIGLIIALRRAQKMRKTLTMKSQQSDFRAQVQATMMVISVVLIFTICETPVVIDRVGQMIFTFPDDSPFLNYARKLGLLLVVIDSVINFLAYVSSNQKFRKGLQLLFCPSSVKRAASYQSSDDGNSASTMRRTIGENGSGSEGSLRIQNGDLHHQGKENGDARHIGKENGSAFCNENENGVCNKGYQKEHVNERKEMTRF